MHFGFSPLNKPVHTKGSLTDRESMASRKKVVWVSVQHTVNRHEHSQKLICQLVLWPLSQISVAEWSCLQLALMIFSSVVLSPPPPTPNNFLQLLIIQHPHLYVSFGFFSSLFTCFFFCVCPLVVRCFWAWPGRDGVGGCCVPDLPKAARHAAAPGWGLTGCAWQRHLGSRNQCISWAEVSYTPPIIFWSYALLHFFYVFSLKLNCDCPDLFALLWTGQLNGFQFQYDFGFPRSLKQDNESKTIIMLHAMACRKLLPWDSTHPSTPPGCVLGVEHDAALLDRWGPGVIKEFKNDYVI